MIRFSCDGVPVALESCTAWAKLPIPLGLVLLTPNSRPARANKRENSEVSRNCPPLVAVALIHVPCDATVASNTTSPLPSVVTSIAPR